MRITTSGCNTPNLTNPNCKSKEQKTQAFNGRINVFADDFKKVPSVWFETIVANVHNILRNKRPTNNLLDLTGGDIIVKGNKASSSFKFEKSFDQKAQELVQKWNEECMAKKIAMRFEFSEK